MFIRSFNWEGRGGLNNVWFSGFRRPLKYGHVPATTPLKQNTWKHARKAMIQSVKSQKKQQVQEFWKSCNLHKVDLPQLPGPFSPSDFVGVNGACCVHNLHRLIKDSNGKKKAKDFFERIWFADIFYLKILISQEPGSVSFAFQTVACSILWGITCLRCYFTVALFVYLNMVHANPPFISTPQL